MIPEKKEFLREFSNDYGYPNGPKTVDEIRATEFSRLQDVVYLDHAGATLYSDLQMEAVFRDLTSNLYANPHSQSESSMATGEVIRQCRQQVLDYFNAPVKAYQCIFTSGATSALKMVGEAFPWSSNSCFAYTMENHNSVLGIREFALSQGAAAAAVDVEEIIDHSTSECGPRSFKILQHPSQKRRGIRSLKEESEGDVCHLFAFPSECNFSGVKFSPHLVSFVKDGLGETLEDSTLSQGQWVSSWTEMSDSKKPTSGNSGPDEVSDRLKSSLKLNVNKPDKKVQLPMGSPVSPLPTGATGGGPSTSTTATSSSSSSSGSVSGRAGSSSHATAKDASHSGEHTSPSTNTSSSAPPKKNVRFCSRSTDNSPTTRRGRGGQKGGRSTDTSPSTGTGRAGHARPPRARGDSRSPARGGRTGSDSSGSTGTHHPTSSHSRGGSVTSPPIKVVLPAGNIVPSGKISTTGLATPVSPRREVLGSGTCNYGHGSIMRGVGSIGGGSGSKSCGSVTGGSSSIGGGKGNVKDAAAVEAEAVKMAGNEQFKKGNFAEALSLYERAISLSPGNASYHCNRAAALVGVGGRILEAVKECENAVRIDPQYFKAHLRLGSLLVRIGQLEAAKKHLCLPGILPDQREHLRLQDVEKHLLRCTETRKKKDWSSTLKEATAAIAAGADECPELYSCQAESLLKLEQLDEAISVLSKIPKSDPSPNCRSQSKFFGISADAYLLYVRAQIEMSSGRFDNAMFSAEGAAKIDARNQEVASLLRTCLPTFLISVPIFNSSRFYQLLIFSCFVFIMHSLSDGVMQ